MQAILGCQSHSSKPLPQQLHQKLRKQLLNRQIPGQLVMPALLYQQLLPHHLPILLRQQCTRRQRQQGQRTTGLHRPQGQLQVQAGLWWVPWG